MSFKHGKGSTVNLGSYDVSAYLNSADLSIDLDVADTTVFGSTWKTEAAGSFGSKFEFGGFYDPANVKFTSLVDSLLPAPLTYCPAGSAAIGDDARLLSAEAASYAESSPVGGMVAVKGSLTGTGTVAFGYVLHPWASDNGTTTGADRDDAASTSTGWTAHIHVDAISGGSWVVKIQDAATNDWADVTPAIQFSAITTATSERIVSATATATVRRHVRYVATRTGGSGALNFLLAFARTV